MVNRQLNGHHCSEIRFSKIQNGGHIICYINYLFTYLVINSADYKAVYMQCHKIKKWVKIYIQIFLCLGLYTQKLINRDEYNTVYLVLLPERIMQS